MKKQFIKPTLTVAPFALQPVLAPALSMEGIGLTMPDSGSADWGSANAKGNGSFFNDDALPQAKSVWDE